jgi:hypothetical protein
MTTTLMEAAWSPLTVTAEIVTTGLVPEQGTSETEDPLVAMLYTQALTNAPDHAAMRALALHHTTARSPALPLHHATAATATSATTLARDMIAMITAEIQIQKTTIFLYRLSYHSLKLQRTMSSHVQS